MPRQMLVCSFAVLSACAVIDDHNTQYSQLAPLTLTPLATAADSTSGLNMGSPLGWTSSGEKAILVKTPGFAPVALASPPLGVPDVNFGNFVEQQFGGLSPVQSPLAAMSLGIDVINTTENLVDSTNVAPPDIPWTAGNYPLLQVGPHGWYAIEFTVNDQVIEGVDDLAPDIAPQDGRRASVFSYVLPDSGIL